MERRAFSSEAANFAEQNRIARGDIAKRHTDSKLRTQFAVEAIFGRELGGGNGGEHRTVSGEECCGNRWCRYPFAPEDHQFGG